MILTAKWDKETIRKEKKKKIQANIPEEYGQKNKQQDVSKPNLTAY